MEFTGDSLGRRGKKREEKSLPELYATSLSRLAGAIREQTEEYRGRPVPEPPGAPARSVPPARTVRAAARAGSRLRPEALARPAAWAIDRAAARRPAPGAEPLDVEILAALESLLAAEARMARTEGRILAWMRNRHAHRDLGFSSFGDLCREVLQIAPRTAQEHLLLHRVLSGSTAAERVFLEGALSVSQILVLAPVLGRRDVATGASRIDAQEPDWLDLAGRLSVRALRGRVRAWRGLHGAGASVAAGAQPEANAGSDAGAQPEANAGSDADARPAADVRSIAESAVDERGRVISFSAPDAFAVLWEDALESARRVLGFDAPRHLCVDAMLAEAAPEMAVAAPDDGPSPFDRQTSARLALGTHTHRQTSARFVPPAGAQALERARQSLEMVKARLDDLDSLASGPDPSGPHEAVEQVLSLHSLSRPLRALTARLLRDLRDTYALWRLGYSGVEDLADSLGLSERATRGLRLRRWIITGGGRPSGNWTKCSGWRRSAW